jgi:hypothetical protein
MLSAPLINRVYVKIDDLAPTASFSFYLNVAA